MCFYSQSKAFKKILTSYLITLTKHKIKDYFLHIQLITIDAFLLQLIKALISNNQIQFYLIARLKVKQDGFLFLLRIHISITQKKKHKKKFRQIGIIFLTSETKSVSFADKPAIINLIYKQLNIQDLSKIVDCKNSTYLTLPEKSIQNASLSPQILADFDNKSKETLQYIEKRNSMSDLPILHNLLFFIREKLIYDVVLKHTKEYCYLAQALKKNSSVMRILKWLISSTLEKIDEIFGKNEGLIFFCEVCKLFFSKKQSKRIRIFPANFNCTIIFDKSGTLIPKIGEELIECKHTEQRSKNIFPTELTKIKKYFTLDHCQLNIREEEKSDSIQSLMFQEISQQFMDKKQNQVIQEPNIPTLMLIGKLGTGKTTLFKKLCGQDQMANFQKNESTVNSEIQLCESKKFYVIDNPAFEVENDDNQQDSKLVEKFANILKKFQISQIYILTNFNRIALVKKEISDCYIPLSKFKQKIQFIITKCDKSENFEEDKINYTNQIESYFGDIPTLFIKSGDSGMAITEKIMQSILKPNVKLEYLDLQDTIFDPQKYCKLREDFKKNLEDIKLQSQMNTYKQLEEEYFSLKNKEQSYQDQIIELRKKKDILEKELKETNNQIRQLEYNSPLTYEERQKQFQLEKQMKKMQEDIEVQAFK